MVINSEAWQSWGLCKYCNICRLYHCPLLISGQLKHKMQWHVNCYFTICRRSFIFGVFGWTSKKSLFYGLPRIRPNDKKVDRPFPASILFSWQPHLSFQLCLWVIGICCHGKTWLHPIFTIDSHRVDQLDKDNGRFFLIHYSIGTNSTVKTLKQLEVAKFTIHKVLHNMENWGATEKKLARSRPKVKITKTDRKRLVKEARDNNRVRFTKNAKKYWVHQNYVKRVTKSLVGSSYSEGRKSQQPLSRL